ncbi:MAG: homocitrate synthase [Massilia sp.]|nr:homocitrate synthase [Massilia sp.]
MNRHRAALHAEAEAQFALAESKLARLRTIDPVLLDVSLREPCFSSYLGHTLQNKIDLLPLVERFGIPHKVIATLDFQDPSHPQVENQFCEYLARTGYDMTGCFALTAVGALAPDGFVPDQSMLQLAQYGIPNTMNEIYLMDPSSANHAAVLDRVAGSVAWLRQHIVGDHGGAPRIYINVVDLMDAFFADRPWCFQMLDLLAELEVDAVSFEDGRGSYFPFQVGAMVKAMKTLLRPDQKVLFHSHAGNGMENASVLEVLLEGADGYWAGMEKESSTIGHASIGELVANLVRAGNPHMAARYQVGELLPICHAMHRINDESAPPETWPIQGSNAYRQMLSGFDQLATRAMDLQPEAIGGTYTFRVSPDGSDAPVLQGRVSEVMGIAIDEACATRMILLMRQDLCDGIRRRYDDPNQLRQLYERAQANPAISA